MTVTAVKDPSFIGRSANVMARSLLENKYRGVGDTIEASAYRLQSKSGLDADITLQGWNRDLEGKGMNAKRWLPLFVTWVETVYLAERDAHENDTALTRLADLVAGQTIQNQAHDQTHD